VQAEDAFSTHWAVNHGAHETVLPGFIAHSLPAMLAFGAVKSYGERRLALRRPWLGRAVRVADIVGTGFAASRNWTNGRHSGGGSDSFLYKLSH
jgi:hypothetical protein